MDKHESVPEPYTPVINKVVTPNDAISLIEKGEIRGLAKAISFVENGGLEKRTVMDYAYKKKAKSTLIVGITGPGGAGKSTLVAQLISEYRKECKTVGVIAVDPSSPYTGGAFLGDRVRMGIHNIDSGVFIRSFGSRDSQGGISESVKSVLYLYRAYHFDVILVESVGTGQDQTEIDGFVDVTVVVFVPGFGDAMQMAKAGIKESADVFIINKSDKPEAVILKEQMENSFGIMREEFRPPIICTIAIEGKGITEAIEKISKVAKKKGVDIDSKHRNRIRAEIRSSVIYNVNEKIEPILAETVEQVLEGTITPYDAVMIITDRIEIKKR